MLPDKYSAIWLSNSSISDYLNCPRSYYLKNIYSNPQNGRKIKLVNPPLALGQVVHEVLNSISSIPINRRFDVPLIARFAKYWEKYAGKKGGFINADTEAKYKNRGQEMIRRILRHPGPLANLAVKIKEELPYYWLSEEDNIILCGKIDWLEYLPGSDSVHIIDFKTGAKEITKDSLQLKVYLMIVSHCQERKVSQASFWYLDRMDEPSPVELPNIKEAEKQIMDIAKQIKTARSLNRFHCSQDSGCSYCKPYEQIVNGEAELVGTDDINRDIYIVKPLDIEGEEKSIIL